MNKIYSIYKTFDLIILRYFLSKKLVNSSDIIKIHYGCGANRQENYINADIRWTPAVDLIASLKWCARHFQGQCCEIYMSHVLEHYGYPGKHLRNKGETVLSALNDCYRALETGGILRIAVPDFAQLSQLYLNEHHSLFPRLSGRLCGEQNYPQNFHKCVFDRNFLEFCLEKAGFADFAVWDPTEIGLSRDSSFDVVAGIKTSLNLCAKKIEKTGNNN